MAANEDYILEILLETGLVTKSQLERARSDQRGDETIIETLVREGAVTEEDVMRALAAHAAMDFVDLAQISIPEEVIAAWCRPRWPSASRWCPSPNPRPA